MTGDDERATESTASADRETAPTWRALFERAAEQPPADVDRDAIRTALQRHRDGDA